MIDKVIFILSMLLIISITVNILQILNFRYTYERIKNNHLKRKYKIKNDKF